jgi:hypothetical protein
MLSTAHFAGRGSCHQTVPGEVFFVSTIAQFLGQMSKTTIRSAVIRVVEIGVTRLRRGEGDDEAAVVADEASNGQPDELLGVDLLPTLPRHQDDIAD